MPTSFKKRINGQPKQDNSIASKEPLPLGLKHSPFPSIVPLFSSGLASLDDFICGHGIPSSSLLTFVPTFGLAKTSDEDKILESRNHLTLINKNDKFESLQKAEDAAIDTLSYSIAQGIVSNHKTVVIGYKAKEIVQSRIPKKAFNNSKQRPTSIQDMKQEEKEDLKIAFRYAHRPKFKTTVDESNSNTPIENFFRCSFEKTEVISKQEIESYTQKGILEVNETTNYIKILEFIRLILSQETSPIRIHLFSLGSSSWSRASDSLDKKLIQLTRFLAELQKLVKQFSIEKDQLFQKYIICMATISPLMVLPPRQLLVIKHLLRFVDIEILLSNFSNDKRLSKVYSGYGGSFSLLKGPSIGSILSPGEFRSILRGGGGEAGAENDVGWKRRWKGKGIVLETLHEDVDADLKSKDADKSSTSFKIQGQDIEDAAASLHKHSQPVEKQESKRIEGIKSLRERGYKLKMQGEIKIEEREY